MTAAKTNFDKHVVQSFEALHIYQFLKDNGYAADFGLRYVWVASISALDNYVSELIVEKAVEQLSNGETLSGRMLSEGVPLSSMISIQAASPTQAIVEFRKIVQQAVRFRTFQKANDVADGLSFIWNEPHKWNKISEVLGISNKPAKYKLNSIAYRRDGIVHNADYDDISGSLKPCSHADAHEALSYVCKVVSAIDELITLDAAVLDN